MENVFERQEMIERYNFSKMLLHYFEPCNPAQSQVSGLSATELYHLYLVHNPHSKLTSGIVHNILLMGGYVQQETGTELELFAKVKDEAFMEADRNVQLVIMKHTVGPTAVKCRQIVLGLKVKEVHEDGTWTLVNNPINSVTIFVSRWTINRNDRYHHYMKPAHRSTVTEVYNFYRVICATYGMPIVSRKEFIAALDTMGYHIITGAVHQKAGYKYFKNIFIPQDVDDIKLSLDINAVVIFNGISHWTKDNELLENYVEGMRSFLAKTNLERMNIDGEPKKSQTPEERESNKAYLRGAAQNIQAPFSIKEATDEERAAVAVLMEQAKELEAKTTQDQTAKTDILEDQRTSGGSEGTAEQPVLDVLNFNEPDKHIIGSINRNITDDPKIVISEDVGQKDTNAVSEPSLSDIVRDSSKHSAIGAESAGYRRKVGITSVKRDITEYDASGDFDVEQEVSTEPVGGTDASFEEIAEAMKIPYQLTPTGEFTLDVFTEWLNKMGIECPDTRAYYKHVMPLIEA